MLLQPKRTSFRKQSKGKLKGIVGMGMKRSNGSVGLRSRELGRISARQLEAARRTIRHHLDREGQV
jgi:large subunit ribosomal protein L16